MPITTWNEANALKDLGVSYLYIAPPLTHQLDKVRRLNIPIRMFANIAYADTMPRKNGVSGGWIRPEDVDAYGQYIDAIEFADVDLKKEQALFRIYTKGEWPGDLNLIINNLNYPGVNRMIDPAISQRRMTCAQRCEERQTCHLCYEMLDLANPEKLKPLIK